LFWSKVLALATEPAAGRQHLEIELKFEERQRAQQVKPNITGTGASQRWHPQVA